MSRSAVNFGPVVPGDVAFVARRAREADRVEVYESSRRDVRTALRMSVERSERTMTVTVDGVPAAICGVGRLSLLSTVGVPWMIGTDAVFKHQRELMLHTPAIVRRMMQTHSVLRNMVHDDNKASIRWLRRVGFRMSEPVAAGWRGAMFRVFEMYKDELDV